MPSESTLEIYLLDMGQEKYGDCIVCRRGDRAILIDGAHPGDDKQLVGGKSIPEQLKAIFGRDGPYRFELLVLTHLHLDHTGCLPALVDRGIVTAKRALVADPDLGYGRVGGQDAVSLEGLDAMQLAVVYALREEGASEPKTDAQVQRLLSDAMGQEEKHRAMMKRLKDDGADVISYRGQKLAALENALSDFELKILGPTKAHLEICAREIAKGLGIAATTVRRRGRQDAIEDAVSLFRELARPLGADALDAGSRPGHALNNQSIVISVGSGSRRALLTGDMQFADPVIKDLAPELKKLWTAIDANKPYAFAKVAHHGAHNALDEATLDRIGAKYLAVSGGYDDPGHPASGVLRLLRERESQLTWARTDKNGLIQVRLTAQGPQIKVSKGALNNAEKNRKIDEAPIGPQPQSEKKSTPPAPSAGGQVKVAESPSDQIEIIARLPNRPTKLTLSIEIGRAADAAPSVRIDDGGGESAKPTGALPGPTLPPLDLFGGRRLPNLLFVTDRAALGRNIGAAETAHVLKALDEQGVPVIDREFSQMPAADAAQLVRNEIGARSGIVGVVLLGGYDVVPSFRLSVLAEDEREALNRRTRRVDDPDDFTVWSDDAYGDVEGDRLPELPVSRVVDAKQADFVFKQLSVGAVPNAVSERFGLRNRNREFADNVFADLPGSDALKTSQSITPTELGRLAQLPPYVYWMLHGADFDTARFWGEYENGRTLEACNINNLPKAFSGVAFAGCCYGALIVDSRANTTTGAGAPAPIPVNRSVSLSMLAAGANSFVGCTAAHYSPIDGNLNHYGAPLHRLFWANIRNGMAPAAALHEAKMEYLPGIPHGPRGLVHVAIEKKIAFQFTCLGLGW